MSGAGRLGELQLYGWTPMGTSRSFRYILDLHVPLGQLGTFWTFRYLYLYVLLGNLGTSWTFRYLFDLFITSWTFRYRLIKLLSPDRWGL